MTPINWIPVSVSVPTNLRKSKFILLTECGLDTGYLFDDCSGFDCEYNVLAYAYCKESFICIPEEERPKIECMDYKFMPRIPTDAMTDISTSAHPIMREEVQKMAKHDYGVMYERAPHWPFEEAVPDENQR